MTREREVVGAVQLWSLRTLIAIASGALDVRKVAREELRQRHLDDWGKQITREDVPESK